MSLSIELVGAAAAMITTLCWVPQALHILRTRQTAGVSLPAYLAFATGTALWFVYGLLIASWPVIGANLVTLVLVIAIIALRLRFAAMRA
jgi:MtN3 and saliva related transmembrane protein